MDIGVDEDFCGGVEVVEGSVDDGSAFDCRVAVVVVVVAAIEDRERVEDDDEPLGARMKSAANAIQPVYAKLTIVLMSVRSYLHATHHMQVSVMREENIQVRMQSFMPNAKTNKKRKEERQTERNAEKNEENKNNPRTSPNTVSPPTPTRSTPRFFVCSAGTRPLR